MNRRIPLILLASSTLALAQVTVTPGPTLTINQTAVNEGAGGQTDPHVSGDSVAYTDNSIYSIRFQNLALGVGSDRIIPHPTGTYDSLSDISGNTIVFTRVGSGAQSVYQVQIDAVGNPGSPVAVSPSPGSLRRASALGGDTIAYEDRGYGSSSAAPPEIALSSVTNPSAPAYRLTTDDISDQTPAVSPDGNAVVWLKCTATTDCDVWRAERTLGAWGTPEQVTGAAGNETLPDTNGPVTVYGSSAGGDENIRFSVKSSSGGYTESYLALPGVQRNPNISGNFIAFESNAAAGAQFDIYLFDLATNTLYQLTNTPVSESLTDISIVTTVGGRLVRVVWAQPKLVYPYDMDVYALSAVVSSPPPCDGGDDGTDELDDPAAVCANPGKRPLLQVLSVTRTAGAPNVAQASFSTGADEGILCVDNVRATAGWIDLNGSLQISPESFKHQVTSIAHEVALGANNFLSATIAGDSDTSYTVRVYGTTAECNASKPSRTAMGTEDALAALRDATANVASIRTLDGTRLSVLSDGARVLEQDSPRFGLAGCSSTGGSAVLGGLLAVLALWALGHKKAPARARR